MGASCKRDEKFLTLGDKVASPSDIAVSPDGEYFYVLNSDLDRAYNTGSILVIDDDGNRVTAVPTPRLGRHMNVGGNVMVVGYEASEESEKPAVRIFDLSNAAEPVLKKEFSIDCSPVNAAIYENYKYFVVTCLFGKILVGELNFTDLSQSTLTLVRTYGRVRRALYIDRNRDLLYMFPTIFGQQDRITDRQLTDTKTYDAETDTLAEGANEVPDGFESDSLVRTQLLRNRTYQFGIYDIRAEAERGFPFRSASTEDDPENLAALDAEHRWLYFTLLDYDGTPDSSAGVTDPTIKHYRTNFWEAKPSASDPNVFYLSQRGHPDGTYAFSNNVVKVTVLTDPRGAEGSVPLTSEAFSFERIYGFKGELRGTSSGSDKVHFPGDFEMVNVFGQDVLLVNHFRDLVYFGKSQRFYSIAASTPMEGSWRDEVTSTSARTSMYQLAANQRGRVMTGSFYGNAVILLEVKPGAGITTLKRIE